MTDDKRLGGILGNLVGDAIGLPYEMVKREAMPDLSGVDDLSVLPAGFTRHHPTIAPMTYSDDGSCALCLYVSLLVRGGRFDAQDFGDRMVRWFYDGYLAAGGVAFGTGGTTRTALARIKAGTPAAQAGLPEESAMGNGGLMRAIGMALLFEGTDAELIEAAMAQCRVTHAHPRAQTAVAIYTLWARYLLRGAPNCDSDDFDDVKAAAFRAIYAVQWSGSSDVWREAEALNHVLRGESPRDIYGSDGAGDTWWFEGGKPTGGFHVVDTLYSAVECQRGMNYTDVVRRAIQYGRDADTTAAVAGAIAGIRFGLAGIPDAWVKAVLRNAPAEVQTMFNV